MVKEEGMGPGIREDIRGQGVGLVSDGRFFDSDGHGWKRGMGPRIREDKRGDGRDWMFRLQLGADSLKFLWPPLVTRGG